MKIAILAGGKGTRLGLTDRPKPMVEVAGQPLLERLVRHAKGCGFSDFIFLTGHMAEVIEDYFGDGSRLSVSITHMRESSPQGTAGSVRDARHLLDEPFLLLYGDTLLDVDLAHMAATHLAGGGIATLFVHPNDHPQDSDLVQADSDRRIQAFLPKPHAPGALLPNLANAALYALDPRALDFIPDEGSHDWGRDIFPAMCAAGERLTAYRSIEYIKDMGTPDRLAKGEADIASGKLDRLSRRHARPAVFLDRDGVLNVEIDGVFRPEDLVLEGDAGAQLRRINQSGLPAICITNQPGLAKGFVDRDGMAAILATLDTRLAEQGAYLDDLYLCPHHPESGWPGEVAELKIACACRKPQPGMLLKAAADHHLDLAQSWFIGDRYSDVAAAHAAGTRSILLKSGHSGGDAAQFDCGPDHVAPNLSAAVSHILEAMA